MIEILKVASDVVSHPKTTATIFSGLVYSHNWAEWVNIALEYSANILGVAALAMSLAVNVQKFRANRREEKNKKPEVDK